MKRRGFLRASSALAAFAATVSFGWKAGATWAISRSRRYLRPPGAEAKEKDFLARCIRCGQCGEICPNQAISFFGTEKGWASLDTPYIRPREQACILCMKCGEVCPTGALQKIERTAEAILDEVRMGRARVDKQLCLSYQGKTCGVCYRACPLPDIAMTIGMLEQPTVTEACIGCGICERSCIQMPQAIRVFPYPGREIST